MKQVFIMLLVLPGVMTTLDSCRKVQGEGPVVTENRSTEHFSSIDFAVPGELYYTAGASVKIEISAQKNILDIIETNFSNNTLKIRVKHGVSLRSNEQIIVKVTGPDVKGLAISGSGNITVSGPFQPADIRLLSSGSGSIKISELVSGKLDAKISGSGKIQVYSGTSTNEELAISGSGSIDIAGVEANEANTVTSGSGTIRLHAKSFLDCKISGSGVVLYKGSPKISSSISGSGRVVPI